MCAFLYVKVIEAVTMILYAADNDSSVAEEALALLSRNIQSNGLSPITEVSEDTLTPNESYKKKNTFAATKSPSDVHYSLSPLKEIQNSDLQIPYSK